MDEELISKKELLETFGISYGALYRWKRMGLIPEAWRKSARRCWPGESSSSKRPMAAGNFPWRRSAARWWRRGRTKRTYCNY